MTGYRYIKRIIDILLSGFADYYIVPAAFDLMHCDQIRFTGTNLLYTKESRHPQDIFPDL